MEEGNDFVMARSSDFAVVGEQKEAAPEMNERIREEMERQAAAAEAAVCAALFELAFARGPAMDEFIQHVSVIVGHA